MLFATVWCGGFKSHAVRQFGEEAELLDSFDAVLIGRLRPGGHDRPTFLSVVVVAQIFLVPTFNLKARYLD